MSIIYVNDSMQSGYSYERSQAMGENFADNFKPELCPKALLALGVFGGKYMNDCRDEFPEDWFAQAKLSPLKKDCSLNYFSVDASQPLHIWQQKGWIHPQDPRGWFQWYCRYYSGRRSDDDSRQIKRWRAFKRHAAAVRINCQAHDFSCRKKQRQALLHWAYDARAI